MYYQANRKTKFIQGHDLQRILAVFPPVKKCSLLDIILNTIADKINMKVDNTI